MSGKLTTNQGICKVGGILSTVILMVGIIILGAITADNYSITQRLDKQTTFTQQQVNKTVSQILATQENNNLRGNATIDYFTKVFQILVKNDESQTGNMTNHRIIANITRDAVLDLVHRTDTEANRTLINQEEFFKPYLNESFGKIFKALNITEG